MKIDLRPYPHDTARWHVDIRLMHPTETKEIRKRARVRPAATRVAYDTLFRNHIGPRLGGLPLAAIDEDRLSSFRAELRRSLSVSTTNLVLSKVAKILRFAKRVRLIASVPEIEKFREQRARPKAVLSDEQIAALVKAAAEIDTTAVIVLLALDAGLRSSEICALEWADVDLEDGSITVQNNTYRGEKQTPKGTIGKVAVTSALRRALERHRRREPIGPLVLYRKSHLTHGAWAPLTPLSETALLDHARVTEPDHSPGRPTRSRSGSANQILTAPRRADPAA